MVSNDRDLLIYKSISLVEHEQSISRCLNNMNYAPLYENMKGEETMFYISICPK